MKQPKFISLVLLALAGAGAVGGSASAGEAVDCRILGSESGQELTLTGLVAAHQPLSGSYEFTVEKGGPAGSSTSAQSGAFEARAGEEVVLGDVTVGMGHGAVADAKLTLRWSGGGTSCDFRRP